MSNPYVADGLCLFAHITVDEAAACAAKGEHVPANICSVCEREIPRDPRGATLDASWRCDECRP